LFGNNELVGIAYEEELANAQKLDKEEVKKLED
jgi:hypothetical protein